MQNLNSVATLLQSAGQLLASGEPPEEFTALLLLTAHLHREHQRLLDAVATLSPAQQWAHSEAAIAAAFGLGQKQQARALWRHFHDATQPPGADAVPEGCWSPSHRGQWAVRLGLLAEAQELHAALPSDTLHYLHFCADLARAERRYPVAEKLYHQAVSETPELLTPCVSLAWLYRRCEQPVSAMLHAMAGLDLLRSQPPKMSRSRLEYEAIWSLRAFFQTSKQRKYRNEVSSYIKALQEHHREALADAVTALAPAKPPEPETPAEATKPDWEQLAVDQFGLPSLRPSQRDVLQLLDDGHHVLAIMPTGAGKSLCYQLPASAARGTVLVVSPLVSLMEDQLMHLPPALREQSAALHSVADEDAQWQALQALARGELRILFVAPERLRHPPFRHALAQTEIALMVVDEGHCVSMWGHDFRPDYLALGKLHKAIGGPQLLILTATAPPHVQQDICHQFTDDRPLKIYRAPLRRDNLWLEVLWVQRQQERDALLASLCHGAEGSGIIYARTRQRCEDLAGMLRSAGINAIAYHAGMTDRSERQAAFMQGDVDIVVATIAFGMGIDKPDIRFVFHDAPPQSLEDLSQQVGRAGRDGLPARCTLLASRRSLKRLNARAQHEWSVERLMQLYEPLKKLLPTEQVTLLGQARMADALGVDELQLRVALSLYEQAGFLVRHDDAPRRVFLRRMDRFQKQIDGRDAPTPEPLYYEFLAEAGVPDHDATVRRTTALAAQLQLPVTAIAPMLRAWHERGFLDYEPRGWCMALQRITTAGRAEERLHALSSAQQQSQRQRVEALLDYILCDQCRHHALIRYLEGEHSPPQPCQSCDHCFVSS